MNTRPPSSADTGRRSARRSTRTASGGKRALANKAHRVVSAEEAIRAIKPGDMVFIEGTSGEPRTLVDALAADHKRLKGTHILDSRVIPGSPYAKLTDFFHVITMHVNPDYRDAVQKGTVDFLPVALTQTPKLFTTTVPLDV